VRTVDLTATPAVDDVMRLYSEALGQ
jgi:hypothetical protein